MMDCSKQAEDYTEEFICSVCLELFTDAVILECGHNFCRSCIDRVWDSTTLSCPECRQEFPVRRYTVNRLLANLIDRAQRLKQGLKKERTDPEQKEDTLEQGAKKERTEQRCEVHGRRLELFCETEKTLICVLCVPKHSGHSFLSLQEAASVYQDKLNTASAPLESKLEDLAKLWNRQEQTISNIQNKARSLEQHITSEFAKLHQFLQDKEQRLIQQLTEEAAGILREMEENLRDIKHKSSTIEGQISAIRSKMEQKDSLLFLTGIQEDTERFTKGQREDAVTKVTLVTHDLNHWMCYDFLSYNDWKEIKSIINFLTPVTLDPNTAHSKLILSEDLTSIKDGGTRKQLPDNPERFDYFPFVLGSEGFTSGRHCWEVEVGYKIYWTVGVVRESINRKRIPIPKPENGFWTVWLYSGNTYLAMDSVEKILRISEKPQKIRVYLDYEGGQVSFYNADSMSHLYTFTDTFTEKLYPIFSPGYNNDDKNAEPLKLLHQRL